MAEPGDPTQLGPEVLAGLRSAVARRESVPAGSVRVGSLRRLSGGASRITWAVSVDPGGEVILQQQRPGSAGANLSVHTQAQLLAEAARRGVPVPEVLGDGGQPGSGFVVLEMLAGESLPKRIASNEDLAAARPELARQVGRACAAIHAMDVHTAPELQEVDPLESMRSLLDALGEPHPAFELGLRRLDETGPVARAPVVVHGDLRMGNLLVAPSGLCGVLDWELAHLGSPVEDLGWFCARAWRFGSPLRAGGVGTVEELLAGYREGGGEVPEPAELDWWEAYACLRWGLISVLQASVHLGGLHRSVELAAIGRRAAECEEDLLQLLLGPSDLEPPTQPEARRDVPHDAPGAGELLDAVAEQLDTLVRHTTGADRFNARVAANAVRLVGREVAFGRLLLERHRARLAAMGLSDDAALAAAIRDGSVDHRSEAVGAAVRAAVRDKLAVSNPGYWLGDGEGQDR